MNKLMKPLFILFLVISNNTFAQSIDGVPLKDLDVEYIEIQITVTNGHKIWFSYGDEETTFVSSNRPSYNTLKDDNGNMIVLSSRIGALNFLAKNGFELIESNADADSGYQYYILRRKDE